jgi:hypothetical protein
MACEVDQGSQGVASLAAQLQAQPSVLSLGSTRPFSLIPDPTSKICTVSVIDNGWCRAGHEEVPYAVRTAGVRKEELPMMRRPDRGVA